MEKTHLYIDGSNSLPDIISHIKKGDWKIPRFQREFVWEKKRVIELLDSMYKGFPIGSFFLWMPPEDYAHCYKDIPELQIDDTHKRYTHFILDGQQRLTSLYVTYLGLPVKGFDYSNICFDLDTEKFNLDPNNLDRNISVHLILQDNYHEIYNKLSNVRQTNFMKLRERFSKYPFPVVIIENKNIEDACKIFERINQGGKRLDIFDLVVAITWAEDFELKDKIDAFNEEIKGAFGKIDSKIFTETISLIINKQCTRAFQLKLKPDDVKEKWDAVEKALKRSIQFLRSHLKINSYSYLPYVDMLPLIAYYFYNKKDAEIDKKFLELWFWKASLSNRYSGSTFTKLGEDRAYVFDKAIRGEEVRINYNINLDLDKIKEVQMGRNTALRNALIVLLVQQQPLSFADNSLIDISKDAISEFNRQEYHHIFPKKFLKSLEIKDKKSTDCLVNFCLIDSALNKEISGKSPKEYLSIYRKKNPELKKALKSQLIPFEENLGIAINDYKTFLDQRANLLLTLLKSKVGDFTANIEEQMSSNPQLLIEKLEQKIRETIINVLYDALGESWWDVEKVIPEDIKTYAKNKIKSERANKPYISEEDWQNPLRLIEQINIPDYQKIILTNWNHFENIFGSKETLQTHLKSFSNIRNQIDHIKTMDQTERKFGEVSIEWLFKCVQKYEEKMACEENEETCNLADMSALYKDLKQQILGINPEVKEQIHNQYTSFILNRSFVDIAIQSHALKVHLAISKKDLSDPRNMAESHKQYKNWSAFKINNYEDIPYAITLIKQAFQFIKEQKTYTEKFHLDGVEKNVISIYDNIKNNILNLDSAISLNPQKYYISFKKTKNFAFLEFQNKKIKIVVMLPYENGQKIIKHHELRQFTEGIKRFYGGPCFGTTVENEDNLDEILDVLREAYKQQNK